MALGVWLLTGLACCIESKHEYAHLFVAKEALDCSGRDIDKSVKYARVSHVNCRCLVRCTTLLELHGRAFFAKWDAQRDTTRHDTRSWRMR